MSKLILVDTIHTFRMRYVIELEDTEPKDRKSTRLNSNHIPLSRMPSSA